MTAAVAVFTLMKRDDGAGGKSNARDPSEAVVSEHRLVCGPASTAAADFNVGRDKSKVGPGGVHVHGDKTVSRLACRVCVRPGKGGESINGQAVPALQVLAVDLGGTNSTSVYTDADAARAAARPLAVLRGPKDEDTTAAGSRSELMDVAALSPGAYRALALGNIVILGASWLRFDALEGAALASPVRTANRRGGVAARSTSGMEASGGNREAATVGTAAERPSAAAPDMAACTQPAPATSPRRIASSVTIGSQAAPAATQPATRSASRATVEPGSRTGSRPLICGRRVSTRCAAG
jgi:hypothetical protein